eukprot:scaffold325500_cov76-Attheya_sp.AAC.1
MDESDVIHLYKSDRIGRFPLFPVLNYKLSDSALLSFSSPMRTFSLSYRLSIVLRTPCFIEGKPLRAMSIFCNDSPTSSASLRNLATAATAS